MFLELVYTELIKYKRSVVIWIIGIGGFLSAVTALLLVSTENSKVRWEVLIGRGMNIMNLLALLLVAVFTGYVFVTEYQESIISILFTYPVSRFKLYIVKYVVIFLFVNFLYLIFFLSTMLLGFIYMGEFLSMGLLLKFIKLTFEVSTFNFVLVPITALFSIIIKEMGTYILVGMSYFIVYIGFIHSDYSLFIPSCIPDKLVVNYFSSGYISKTDFIGIVIVSVVIFSVAFLISAFCYLKSDVYKLH
jgi:bacitracin transport system permease protein